MIGGTKSYAFRRLHSTFLFEPATEEWIRVGDMAYGRWYPSATTLGDGRFLAAGGIDAAGSNTEIYSPLTGWAPRCRAARQGNVRNMILLRDGCVLFTGAWFGGDALQPFVFDP